MNSCNSGAEKGLSDDIPKKVRKFTYEDIYNATNNFTSIIGQGGFGTVYKGSTDGTLVAVKKLESPEAKSFIIELNTLTRFQHENLLSIIGYCDEPAFPSIVLEYMPNGSLYDRLEDKSKPLPWDVRIKIANGAALGINHLHTSGEKPMVHRDIKSANILLNEEFVPKVADFGLVRDGDSGLSTVREVTQNLCYTRYYEAPEVRDGDVSIKLDTYSFGMVLLELLTGLKPYHINRPLRKYRKKQILGKLLDSGADWNKPIAEKVYKISKLCLKNTKKTRPTIFQILPDLQACLCYIPGGNMTLSYYDGGEYDGTSGEDIEDDSSLGGDSGDGKSTEDLRCSDRYVTILGNSTDYPDSSYYEETFKNN